MVTLVTLVMMTTMAKILFGTKASAAAEAVLDRDAFLDKPFFLVLCHWIRQLMMSSSRVLPDLRPAGSEPR